jgi:hypothetical protein
MRRQSSGPCAGYQQVLGLMLFAILQAEGQFPGFDLLTSRLYACSMDGCGWLDLVLDIDGKPARCRYGHPTRKVRVNEPVIGECLNCPNNSRELITIERYIPGRITLDQLICEKCRLKEQGSGR